MGLEFETQGSGRRHGHEAETSDGHDPVEDPAAADGAATTVTGARADTGRRTNSTGQRADAAGRRAEDASGRRAALQRGRRAGDLWERRAGDRWDWRSGDTPEPSGEFDALLQSVEHIAARYPAEHATITVPPDIALGGFGPATARIRTPVLRTYSRLLRLVLDETRDAVLVFDSIGDVILSNRALDSMLGAQHSPDHGHRNVRDLLHALGAEVDSENLDALLASHARPRVRLQLRDGGTIECGVTPLSLETPGDHHLMIFHDSVAAGTDLSDLHHRAFYDRLTGLPNRELVLDRLEQALARLGRDGGAVAVIFIDLDGFKTINDQHGHAMGDRVLVEVAARLMAGMRQVDTVSRLGGDEFVIVCDGVAETQSVGLICSRIRESLSAPIEADGHTLTVGASIGAVVERTSGAAPADVLHRADEEMYRAKRDGTYIQVRRAADADRRSTLAGSLRAALEHGRLDLVYLPLVALDPDNVVAVEALLRCSSPELAGIGPSELVELAEEAGVVQQLSRWILQEAASAVAALRASTESDVSVLINLSSAQLADPSLKELITAAAASAGIARRLIGFDIAESVMVTGSEALEFQLDVLVELGCQLFADNVTGPIVAIELLSELGFSSIKLDQSVIAASADTPAANAAAKALATRAHELQLSVVGKGIADERALQTARQIGCNGGQGYGFFGFPRPLDQLRQLID